MDIMINELSGNKSGFWSAVKYFFSFFCGIPRLFCVLTACCEQDSALDDNLKPLREPLLKNQAPGYQSMATSAGKAHVAVAKARSEVLKEEWESLKNFEDSCPARAAREGIVFSDRGPLDMTDPLYAQDNTPISDTCGCFTCQGTTRSELHQSLKSKKFTGTLEARVHNRHCMMRLEERNIKIVEKFKATL